MRTIKRFYRRLGEWARNLSRLGYASFIGIVSSSSYLFTSMLFGELAILKALTMGLTLSILHYAANRNQQA